MSQGIFGIIDFNKHLEKPDGVTDAIKAFLCKDGAVKTQFSSAADPHYILGMRRICDGSGFQQSQIAYNREFETLCIMHGEIHNHPDLLQQFLSKNTCCSGDLDLVLHLYQQHGPRFAQKLNGLFSLAILDKRNSLLILLSDRFGMAHQLYWIRIGSRFYFATHLKTLLLGSGVQAEIDLEGLNLFLKYSYIPSPWTIFKGIRKLPPGHMLTYRDGNMAVTPYWEFHSPDGTVPDLQEASSHYKDLLRRSILCRLGKDRPTGVLLSGGLDSSGNVALAAECTTQKLKTFSVGFEDPIFDERPYAKMVAQQFGTQHFESVITGDEIDDLPKLIWHLEEPYFEFGLFLTYKGFAAAREEADTVIGGEGADQLFGTGGFAGGRPAALHYLLKTYHLLALGQQAARILKGSYFYDHDNLAFKSRMLWDRAIDLNNWYFYGFDEHELLSLYRDPTLAVIPKVFSDDLVTRHPTLGTRHFSFEDFYLETQINQDLKHYVNENVMVKSGRMADMLDLTLRESYLDKEVSDFLVSLDYSLKRSGGLFDHLKGDIKTKLLHRKTMEGLLPSAVMAKPKQGGFVPVMIFLKNPKLRNDIYRHLLNSKTIKEYFKTDYMKGLFTSYEGMQGRKIYWHNFYNSKANRILFLLTLDIWHYFYLNQHPLEVALPTLHEYLNS